MGIGEFFSKANHEAAENFVAVEATIMGANFLDGEIGGRRVGRRRSGGEGGHERRGKVEVFEVEE